MAARAALLALTLLACPTLARAQTASDALGDPTGAQTSDPTPRAPATGVVVPPPPSYGGPAVSGQPTQDTRAARRAARREARLAARRQRAQSGAYSPTWALLIPGMAAFLAPYVIGVMAAIVVLGSGPSSEAEWLFAPVIGPLVLAGQDGRDEDSIALFASMGVAEAIGLGLMIAGLAINRYGGDDDEDVSVVPLLGPGLAGASVAGRF